MGVGGYGREAVHTWGKRGRLHREPSRRDSAVSSTLTGHPDLEIKIRIFKPLICLLFVKASGRINEVLGIFHLKAVFCIITHL